MEKLDCLVWAAGISFISFGMRIGVRVSTPELLEKVLAYLPPGWKFAPSPRVERLYSFIAGGAGPQPNVRKFHLLYGNSQRLARFARADGLLETFEADLNSNIAEGSRQWFFLHAGVIGWKGQAVLIPGRSFSGKTTLVKEFLRMGADYYSDEFAPLDGNGRVHPFPRQLSIRENISQGQVRVAAEELGGKTGVKPLPIGLVLLTQHKPGTRWRPKAMSPGRASLGLLANAFAARRQPERALATVEKLVCRAQILTGSRGEAKEVVESILQRLASPIE